MWLVRINWLRQFAMALFFAWLTLGAYQYANIAFRYAWTVGHSLVPFLLAACCIPVFGCLAVGAFLNGARALAATLRAKFSWRLPRSPNIIPALLIGSLALSLAACAANKPELPQAKGAWIHLNGDKYPADQNDISHAPPESGRLVGAQR